MIVRILGEGQFDVEDARLDELNRLDDQLVEAIDAGDEARFAASLDELLTAVRMNGARVPDDHLGGSELVLPAAGATLEEVRRLLDEEGLIPG